MVCSYCQQVANVGQRLGGFGVQRGDLVQDVIVPVGPLKTQRKTRMPMKHAGF
jgi:hypothetical protein